MQRDGEIEDIEAVDVLAGAGGARVRAGRGREHAGEDHGQKRGEHHGCGKQADAGVPHAADSGIAACRMPREGCGNEQQHAEQEVDRDDLGWQLQDHREGADDRLREYAEHHQ